MLMPFQSELLAAGQGAGTKTELHASSPRLSRRLVKVVPTLVPIDFSPPRLILIAPFMTLTMSPSVVTKSPSTVSDPSSK